MTIQTSGKTDKGLLRPNNEDAISIISYDLKGHWGETQFTMALLADGMGGNQGGEVASRMAIDIVIRMIARQMRFKVRSGDFLVATGIARGEDPPYVGRMEIWSADDVRIE